MLAARVLRVQAVSDKLLPIDDGGIAARHFHRDEKRIFLFAASKYDELGRVISRAINSVGTSWQFDALARATTETNVLGTFAYTYDGPTNRLATVTYPNGQTSEYAYFGNSGDRRLQTIHHRYPNAAMLSKFDYTYDPVGNIQTWRQQADTAAVTWSYGYDAADELVGAIKRDTDVVQTVLNRYAYGYDAAGNRTIEQIDDAVTGATFNVANELVSRQASGKMVFKGTVSEPATVTVGTTPAVVSASNQFEAAVPVVSGSNSITITARDASGNIATRQFTVPNTGSSGSFTYDANGNLTSDGTRTFEWDARNQLLAVTVGTHRSEFAYDGQQRRVHEVEKENGITQSDTNAVWCQSEICEERAADGTTITRRAFRFGEQITGVSHYFATDHLGSVHDATDGSGILLARYAFDPWGRRTLAAGTDITRVGFTGHRWQSAESLWLSQYRALDSDIGRWINEDPLERLISRPGAPSFSMTPSGSANALRFQQMFGHRPEINLYDYVENNPLNRRDSLGLWSSNDTCKAGCVALGAACVTVCVTGFTTFGVVSICTLFCTAAYESCIANCNYYCPVPPPAKR